MICRGSHFVLLPRDDDERRMSTSRPRTPVTDRLSQLVSSRPSSRPSSPTTGTDTSTLPVSDPPSAQAVLDPLMQQLRRSTSHRTTSALAKSSSTGMQAKSTATRALTSPAAAVVRNANTPAPHTVDAESLPAALSAALSDEDVYAPQRQLIDCVPRQRPINLVQQQQSMHKQGATVRHPQSFLSLPSLTGSPYLDGLARISLPTYRGPTFGGSPLVKDEPAPTSPTNAIASLRQIASRSNSVSSVREIHTTAAQATSPTSPAWWWFQNKGDVDKLLDESDQAETVENEGEQIRKKCMCVTPAASFALANSAITTTHRRNNYMSGRFLPRPLGIRQGHAWTAPTPDITLARNSGSLECQRR